MRTLNIQYFLFNQSKRNQQQQEQRENIHEQHENSFKQSELKVF